MTHRQRLKFTTIAELAAHTLARSGGDKAFKDKSPAQKAYTNIAAICSQDFKASPVTMLHIKHDLLYRAEATMSAARERIYCRVASRIVAEESSEDSKNS